MNGVCMLVRKRVRDGGGINKQVKSCLSINVAKNLL